MEDSASLPDLVSAEREGLENYGLPLAIIHIPKFVRQDPAYVARTDGLEKASKLDLRDWLRGKVYFGRNRKLSRADACWIASTQDGFRHVDREISNPSYIDLETEGARAITFRRNSAGIRLYIDGEPSLPILKGSLNPKVAPITFAEPDLFIKGGLDATIRTIAGELQFFLNEALGPASMEVDE